MDLEALEQYEVQGAAVAEDGQLWISCDRCGWVAVYDELHTLAELVRRAEEHGEACG